MNRGKRREPPPAESFEPGRYADPVSGDPLADATVLERVGFVMKGGEVYKNELARGR